MLWRGTPYRFVAAVGQHEDWRIFTTHALLDELADVLSRPLQTKRLAFIDRTAHQVLADYIQAVDFVTPRATPRVIEADPDDDHVIAAAVTANADLIISGDRHLLALGSHQNIRILNPADALSMISAEGR